MNPPLWPPPEPGTRWLLRLPNWIGDAVMVLPALRSLPLSPEHTIGVAHPRVRALYEATGLFARVAAARGVRAPVELRRELARFAPHRALVFTEAPSGAVLARLSGAALRMGRGRRTARLLYTHPLPPGDRERRLWRQYLETAVAAGGRAPERPDFRLEPGPEAARAAAGKLAPPGDRRPVALAPGAAYGPAKRWPEERFVALAGELIRAGRDVVVVGGGGEREAGSRLAAAGALDLTGRTGLLEAVALLARCRALVTNDSGALHMGRAAGVPVVALFGSSSPRWTGPETEEGIVLYRNPGCSPCFKRECPLTGEAHLKCLLDIEVDDVLQALRELPDGAAASSAEADR